MIHYDRRGVPIHKGDLLKTPHFVGARRKMHYLYHVIVEKNGKLFMVPTFHLEPSMASGGGTCPLDAYSDTWASEVISGYGPGGLLSFDDRIKEKKNGQQAVPNV